jgi:hypothetical protein
VTTSALNSLKKGVFEYVSLPLISGIEYSLMVETLQGMDRAYIPDCCL